ncbi:hypothetical protein EC957_003367 [Mortierella hygrophila]|uniref:PiggyBac transposable element-derived protein domain-containing protein n=1 Tax=Mortierella hygrophila TaxID=979708 RepID=A0A9P6F375_9FUNG|nr:hypothetical protein EC957_003367 [Mortierella hygrophila]
MDSNLELLGSFDGFDSQGAVIAPAEEDKAQEEFSGDEKEGEEEEKAGDERMIAAPAPSTKKMKAAKKVARKPARETGEVPPVPNLDTIFRHYKDGHPSQSNLPCALQLDEELALIDIFSLFFSDKVFSDLAAFTNANAASKEAGLDEGSRRWEETTPTELRIFIGITIYTGMFRHSRVDEYRSTNPEYPQHSITHFMTLFRSQQRKHYLHVSNLYEPEQHWFSKVEPLSTKLATDLARYYVPSTNVSIEEMID